MTVLEYTSALLGRQSKAYNEIVSMQLASIIGSSQEHKIDQISKRPPSFFGIFQRP